jgi:hypothetical protein
VIDVDVRLHRELRRAGRRDRRRGERRRDPRPHRRLRGGTGDISAIRLRGDRAIQATSGNVRFHAGRLVATGAGPTSAVASNGGVVRIASSGLTGPAGAVCVASWNAANFAPLNANCA